MKKARNSSCRSGFQDTEPPHTTTCPSSTATPLHTSSRPLLPVASVNLPSLPPQKMWVLLPSSPNVILTRALRMGEKGLGAYEVSSIMKISPDSGLKTLGCGPNKSHILLFLSFLDRLCLIYGNLCLQQKPLNDRGVAVRFWQERSWEEGEQEWVRWQKNTGEEKYIHQISACMEMFPKLFSKVGT